jgi:hypothetical protein
MPDPLRQRHSPDNERKKGNNVEEDMYRGIPDSDRQEEFSSSEDEEEQRRAPAHGSGLGEPADSSGLVGEPAPSDKTGLVGKSEDGDSSGLAGSGTEEGYGDF